MNLFIFFGAVICLIMLITIFATSTEEIDELSTVPTTTNDELQSPMNVSELEELEGGETSHSNDSSIETRKRATL